MAELERIKEQGNISRRLYKLQAKISGHAVPESFASLHFFTGLQYSLNFRPEQVYNYWTSLALYFFLVLFLEKSDLELNIYDIKLKIDMNHRRLNELYIFFMNCIDCWLELILSINPFSMTHISSWKNVNKTYVMVYLNIFHTSRKIVDAF